MTMANRRSPARVAIMAALADGEWHDREQLLEVGARAVPPGRAFRAGEADRQRQRPLGPGPRVRGGEATSIAAGRRAVARAVLKTLAGVERDGDRYRLVTP